MCWSCKTNLDLFTDFKNICLQNDKKARKRSGIKVEEVILDDLVWEDESSHTNSQSYNTLKFGANIGRKLGDSKLEKEIHPINKLPRNGIKRKYSVVRLQKKIKAMLLYKKKQL